MRSFTAALALLVTASLTTSLTPSAQAADGGDRTAPQLSHREAVAHRALVRAQTALAGKGGDATLALRDLHLQRDSLSPADRAAAAKLAGRPNKTNTLDSGNIRVHYNPAELTGPFTATDVLNTSVSISQLYTAAGYRQPLADGTKGGTSATDIYVDTLDPGLYGYCTADNDTDPGPQGAEIPAYCVVDNDYDPADFPTNTPLENLQVTVAHEYFHATQYAYDYFEDRWLLESTAAWVEDEAYTDVNDNVQYLANSPITLPKRSIDLYGDTFHYGVWVFWRYLTERFPTEQGMLPKLVLDVWNAADSTQGKKQNKYSIEALDSVLSKDAYGKIGLDQAFSLFSDATRRRGSFSEGVANHYKEKKLAGAVKLGPGASKSFDATLDHLTSTTFRFRPKKGAQKLEINVVGPPSAQGTRTVVTIWRASGKIKQKYLAISNNGRGVGKVAFNKKKVKAVEVTLVNASIRYTACKQFLNGTAYACGGKPSDEDESLSVTGAVV